MMFDYLCRDLLTVLFHRFQLLQGLFYIHRKKAFHRDIKPENLLIKDKRLKITDFGLVCHIENHSSFTQYVSTRWYRAPEILLRAPKYTSSVDIWAAGCIMAELLEMIPIFPGKNEQEQLCIICEVLGSPTESTWREGILLAKQCGFQFPNIKKASLERKVPRAGKYGLDLMKRMLAWNPKERLTAEQALQHPYFVNAFHPWAIDETI